MGRFRDAMQRQAAKNLAKKEDQKRKWREHQEKWQENQEKASAVAASEAAAVKDGHNLEAFRAWQRGDAIFVYTTGQSIANRDYEQRIINAEVNAIARVGWVIRGTATKTGYVIFTFVRPSTTITEPGDRWEVREWSKERQRSD